MLEQTNSELRGSWGSYGNNPDFLHAFLHVENVNVFPIALKKHLTYQDLILEASETLEILKYSSFFESIDP